ncbi:NUDIX domain-containing protein [Acidaminobacter sp. JC074]|uniref:NUDIX domain-containing protein n=1 Tax=Acidaminobacter sp. JC074 TaxID=2530199 RepID=UPI001F0CE4E0|nr:NUDIX domain-containing protein [Acidaminobacter sp. JC074]MCH4890821.1 NUDIX domain-containing protein [Acidaminobacter sp. JC074]
MGNKFGEKQEGVRYQERVGVYGLVYTRSEFVVAKVNDGYFFVGGGLEDGESHERCLKREFLEEVGYTIEIGDYLGVQREYHQSFRSKNYYELIGHCYEVKLIEQVASGEDDHRLVHLKHTEIKRMTLEYQKHVMKEMIKKL